MAILVSPGISITENDLTASASAVSVSDAAFAGPFQWGPALEHRNIGTEDDMVKVFGKPDDTIAPSWFSAQAFLTYSNLLHVVRVIGSNALNSTNSAKPLTGTVVGATGNTTWVANTGFQTTGLVPGQIVTIADTQFTVNAITNTTAFTTTAGPAANVANGTVAVYGLLIRNENHYTSTYENGASGYGPWIAKYAGDLGNSLKVSVAASANAFSCAANGTLTLTAGSNTVTATGSAFANTFIVGDYLDANGTLYQVSSVTNATQLILSTPAQRNATLPPGSWFRRWEYFTLFNSAPGTSAYVSERGGSLDELHAVVVDKSGLFTGVPGTVLERYAFVSKAADAKDGNGSANYYASVINQRSQYIRWLTAPTSSTTNWGSNATGNAFGAALLPETLTFIGGQSDNANVSDADLQTGYDMFKNPDEIDISLIITGPVGATTASYIIQNICEVRQDCVAFVSPPKAAVVDNVGLEVTDIVTFRNSLPSSSYGFLDSGWKWAYDKYNDKYRWVPLNGDVAGITARTDTTNDPWFSPAGYNRGNVKNVVKLAWNPQQIDRDAIYKLGINPIVSFPNRGIVLYGDRTLLARPSFFDRINVRRLFIIMKKTVSRLAQAQLFEVNDEYTRSQFRNMVEPYLRDVRARRGITDYRVVCDDSNNPPEVVNTNRFVGDIYVKPALSINFIYLNFTAVRNGVSFQEVTGSGV